jgi:hypothetical protein
LLNWLNFIACMFCLLAAITSQAAHHLFLPHQGLWDLAVFLMILAAGSLGLVSALAKFLETAVARGMDS